MTEEIPAAPGWLDERLDEAFAMLGGDGKLAAARDQYAQCLAGVKAPAAPSDLLGAEGEPCRRALLASLETMGVEPSVLDALGQQLEEIEAELAADS